MTQQEKGAMALLAAGVAAFALWRLWQATQKGSGGVKVVGKPVPVPDIAAGVLTTPSVGFSVDLGF